MRCKESERAIHGFGRLLADGRAREALRRVEGGGGHLGLRDRTCLIGAWATTPSLAAGIPPICNRDRLPRSCCKVDPRGMYRIRLFDPQEQKWKIVVVDDFVPCEKDSRQQDGVRRGRDGTPEVELALGGSEVDRLRQRAYAGMTAGLESVPGTSSSVQLARRGVTEQIPGVGQTS